MPSEKTGYIYMLENKINGKQYIGQTTNINQRMREHLSRDERKGINKALAKYGMDNFTLKVLEKPSMDKISEREIYWINEYNTFQGNGYNLKKGGGRNDGKNNPMYGVTGVKHHSYGKPSPQRGVPLSNEHKKKLRQALKGKMQGLDNPNAVLDIKDSENILLDRIKYQMSMAELADKYGISKKPIGEIIHGRHWTISKGNLQDLVEKASSNLNYKVDKCVIDRILVLRERGRTYKEIAQRVPVNFSVVGEICRGEHYLCGD